MKKIRDFELNYVETSYNHNYMKAIYLYLHANPKQAIQGALDSF